MRAAARRTALLELPERLSLFGPTRLGTDQIAVLSALGANRDVHVWIPHPSIEMWGSSPTVNRRVAAPTTCARSDVAHPLLASLARDVRELQSRLGAIGMVDVHHPGPSRPATLLGQLQSDIAADRQPSSWPVDDTVEIHSCHGPAGRWKPCGSGCCTCSRTIRRSSRATSSSCAQTSRRTRRWSGPRSARASRDRSPTPGTACGCGSRIVRCTRPIRYWEWSRRCSTSRTPGSPSARSSIWPRPRRCGAASASTTTTSNACGSGRWPRRAVGDRPS